MYRHATDIVSLVAGILFAGIFGIWALRAAHVISWHGAWTAGPIVLIAAGAAGLVVSLIRPGYNGAAARQEPYSGPDGGTSNGSGL